MAIWKAVPLGLATRPCCTGFFIQTKNSLFVHFQRFGASVMGFALYVEMWGVCQEAHVWSIFGVTYFCWGHGFCLY
ncbi:hypothetical protein RHMOL_Rhmol03G0110900 [Rhododendron molle]|uniref:Uncharacterized protein n=1 Tax=Rhododendron molle TaxID=49168 RepID=A0ACC0PE73_RHOML|nr:hypothetical protein RHMOL_Rhmol03G0110900 [Rhododendron molle]